MKSRHYYLMTGNYVKTAEASIINESTARNIINKPAPENLKSAGDRSGAGRPFIYPSEIEDDLINRILKLRDLNLPVSVLTLQEKAKSVIKPYNFSFSTSRGWVEKFFIPHKLSLLSRTAVSQKLPRQLEGAITTFFEDAARFMRIGKYPRSLVGNMGETPAIFDMVPAKSKDR